MATQLELASTLARGLAPRAVAIYGASARTPPNQAARIVTKLLATGYHDRVVIVNPNSPEICGAATVPSALDSPLAGQLDLAIIAVPREIAVSSLEDAAGVGIGLAIVTSAKFAESDARGRELQDALVARARELGVRLIGPNCMGLINYTDGLVAAGRELAAPRGSISVVAQSGYLSMRLMDYIAETGQGVDLWVTMGNCADLKPADLIEYLGTRPSTSVVVVYLENVADPARLSDAIRSARSNGTDVVLLKSGRTAAGSLVAASHTGALASPDIFVDVLAAESDAIRVSTIREAAQVASLIAAFGRRPTGPFLVTSGSGGDCVLAGDWCEQLDLPLARLSDETLGRAHAIVPEAGWSNPLDMSPFPFEGGANHQLDVVSIMAADPDVGAIVLMDGWGWLTKDTPAGRTVDLGSLTSEDGRLAVPIIVDSRIPAWQRHALVAAGFAVTSDGETIWRSLGHIVGQARLAGQVKAQSPTGQPSEGSQEQAPRLPELEAFAQLRAAGIPMVATEVLHSEQRVRAMARQFGYPIVMKGLVLGVVHKADAQLVHTDIWGDDEALVAWKRLEDAVAGQGTVVIQPQLRGALAEVIVATRDDARYGLHIMVGGGGKWVEAESDIAWASAPLSPAEARLLLLRTRIGRGLAAKHPEVLDESALPAVVAAIGDVAAKWIDRVSEIEINPLMLRREDTQAVDAVVTLRV